MVYQEKVDLEGDCTTVEAWNDFQIDFFFPYVYFHHAQLPS